jgi:hypothetical protein
MSPMTTTATVVSLRLLPLQALPLLVLRRIPLPCTLLLLELILVRSARHVNPTNGLLNFRVQALLDMLQVDMKIRTVLRSWDERLCQFVTKQRLQVSLRLLLLQVLQMLLLSPDISLVCGVHDIEVVENLVDVLFPQRTDRGVPARPWALVALTSGRLPIHGESDTSRCKHCQSERMSVG